MDDSSRQAPAALAACRQGFSESSSVIERAESGGFEVEPFLCRAKLGFLRLQAAWDEGNLDEIRADVTPEMLSDLKSLLVQRRPDEHHVTHVVELRVELLDVEVLPNCRLASVRFFGMIAEQPGQPAAS